MNMVFVCFSFLDFYRPLCYSFSRWPTDGAILTHKHFWSSCFLKTIHNLRTTCRTPDTSLRSRTLNADDLLNIAACASAGIWAARLNPIRLQEKDWCGSLSCVGGRAANRNADSIRSVSHRGPRMCWLGNVNDAVWGWGGRHWVITRGGWCTSHAHLSKF